MNKLTEVARMMGFQSLNEPIRLVKDDEYKGYKYQMRRNTFHSGGVLLDVEDNTTVYFTGYIFIPEGDKAYDLDLESVVTLHGGITYDKKIGTEGNMYRMIGFDTAHFNDYMVVNSNLVDFTLEDNKAMLGSLSIWSFSKVEDELHSAIDNLISEVEK